MDVNKEIHSKKIVLVASHHVTSNANNTLLDCVIKHGFIYESILTTCLIHTVMR